ncbi:MAG TPA: paraquat-inducible protein A [Opitutaceae bacterium]|nr:paraquat-inducible protein A [Opitutaceae bacterium]
MKVGRLHEGVAAPLAYSIAALFLLVPANVLPVMYVASAGSTPYNTTIFSGVTMLCRDGLWALGAIVFTASILVPLLKLAGLARLLWAVQTNRLTNPRRLMRIFGTIEFIGKWSMLDVFLVGYLTGAVRFGALARIAPRDGIVAFAGAVVLTMLATHAFDPRLIWREQPKNFTPKESI